MWCGGMRGQKRRRYERPGGKGLEYGCGCPVEAGREANKRSAKSVLISYCHWCDSSEVRVQTCMVALTVLTGARCQAARKTRLG